MKMLMLLFESLKYNSRGACVSDRNKKKAMELHCNNRQIMIMICCLFLVCIKAQIAACFVPITASSIHIKNLHSSNNNMVETSLPVFHHRKKTCMRICTSLRDTTTSAMESEDNISYYIRNVMYGELSCVADILIDSFYNPSALSRHYYYLSELSRLQGNFPYGDVEHSFFVACQKVNQKEIIVGFVDVDARPGTKESDAPRPYLSDLAVMPGYRRKGIAQLLVSECETEAQLWGKTELHLRVERANNGALDMYEKKLGYEAMEHHYFGVKDTTILLKRHFQEEEDQSKMNYVARELEAVLDFVI